MGRRDPIAAAALRFKPMQSAMPGTTLGPIEFEAFPGGGVRFARVCVMVAIIYLLRIR